MERDFESYQKSVRLVMQEAGRGALRGIHGPVSRLIRTDDQYTVAIEIALGAAMQQIVVSSEADGKAAIAYLKRTGGGRATFLPLTGIQGRELQENGLEDCRGFVAVASRLVSCEDRYRAVVDNLLGRTVIVRDLDAAIAMSKKYHSRFKIVTLDGQVMNPGGSMTGGSVNKEAGILSRSNELEKLTREEKQLQEELLAAEAEAGEAKRLAEEVTFQLTGAQEQLREAQDQVLRLEGKAKQHEILLSAITDARESAQREYDSLRERDKTDRERLSVQTGKIQSEERELSEIRAKLLTLEGSQTEAAQKANGITEEMTARKTEKAALEAEQSTAQAHMEDLRQLRTAMEGDREKKLTLI